MTGCRIFGVSDPTMIRTREKSVDLEGEIGSAKYRIAKVYEYIVGDETEVPSNDPWVEIAFSFQPDGFASLEKLESEVRDLIETYQASRSANG